MIVKFFNRGKGRGSGAIDYLLGKNRDRPQAKLLRGHPDETAAIIDGSLYAKKYTSGVLSFEESNITETMKRQIMDSFEECLFAGLDPNQYNCLWVEHRDKGRLELNFVIPNIELLSGKRLQPYFHAADHKRVDAWRTIQNLQYGLSDPDDPAKRRNLTYAKDLPKSAQEAQQAITDGLMSLIQAGAIHDRTDIIRTLENAGFKISRTTAHSISLENPEQGKRNIRLKGALYEENFRFGADFSAELRARSENHRATNQARLERATNSYSVGIEKKRAEHNRRYPNARATNEHLDSQILPYEFDFSSDWVSSAVGSEFLFGQNLVSNSQGISIHDPREPKIGGFNAQSQDIEMANVFSTEWQEISLRSSTPRFGKNENQGFELSNNFSTSTNSGQQQVTGEHDDRDRNRVIERIGELARQRTQNCRVFTSIAGESETVGERKSRIERANRTIQHCSERTKRNVAELERTVRAEQDFAAKAEQYFERFIQFIEKLKAIVIMKRFWAQSNNAKPTNPSRPNRSLGDMEM